jgi:hypothetical protein
LASRLPEENQYQNQQSNHGYAQWPRPEDPHPGEDFLPTGERSGEMIGEGREKRKFGNFISNSFLSVSAWIFACSSMIPKKAG